MVLWKYKFHCISREKENVNKITIYDFGYVMFENESR